MKHIDLEAYIEAANASDEAWNAANEKLVEFERKIKELQVIKAQIGILLNNTSMGTEQLRSLVMDLEKYYACMCGEFEDSPIHNSHSLHSDSHAYVNAHEFRSKDK